MYGNLINGANAYAYLKIGNDIIYPGSIAADPGLITIHPLCGEDGFAIGQFGSAEMSVSVTNASVPADIVSKPIEVYMGYQTSGTDEAPGYTTVKVGTFYTSEDKLVTRGLFTTITAYDASYYATGLFLPTGNPDTVQAVLSQVLSQSGLQLAANAFSGVKMPTSTPVYADLTGLTYRDVIMHCALLLGVNACIDRDGKLTFRGLGTTSVKSYDDGSYAYDKYTLQSNAAYVLGKLRVEYIHEETTGTGEEQETEEVTTVYEYTASGAQSLKGLTIQTNDIRTQAATNSLGAALLGTNGISIYGYSLEVGGRPELDLGDMITLTDDSGTVRKLYLLSHTLTFNGTLTSEFAASVPVVDITSYSTMERATLSDQVQQLTGMTAQINRLVADTIVATNAKFGKVEAQTAEIVDAKIENLEVGTINGKAIKNSAVLAKALSNEMVETALGVAVYYSAEEPRGGTYNAGDIWYKTITDAEDPYTDVIYVHDGSRWVLADFDIPGGILRANLITAQEIAANTITANEINTDTLHIMGAENDYHLKLEANRMIFSKADEELFKIVAQAPEEMTLSRSDVADAEDMTGSWLMIADKAKFVKSITDANGRSYDGVVTDMARRYNCIAVPNVSPSTFAYPVLVKYYADYTVYDAITAYGDAKIIGDGYYSGNVNAKEHYCRSQRIELGRYVASGVLTSTGGAIEFSIPTGRAFDPESYIKHISFNILMRATNAAGAGIYIIKSSSGGTGSAVLDWDLDKEYTTADPVMDFYDGANNHRTPRVKPEITLEGGTNIRFRWDTATNHYFTGNATNSNNTNNNACVVWLGSIDVEIEQPQIIEVETDEIGASTPGISGGLL